MLLDDLEKPSSAARNGKGFGFLVAIWCAVRLKSRHVMTAVLQSHVWQPCDIRVRPS
jgi:hypothetical protein